MLQQSCRLLQGYCTQNQFCNIIKQNIYFIAAFIFVQLIAYGTTMLLRCGNFDYELLYPCLLYFLLFKRMLTYYFCSLPHTPFRSKQAVRHLQNPRIHAALTSAHVSLPVQASFNGTNGPVEPPSATSSSSSSN